MTHSIPVSDGHEPVPMWIPTPGGHVFAWYHPPAAQFTRRCAILLCDPFGMDRMVLHLTYRHLALRLAEAGFPVLRVDYPGTCDSEGTPRQAARVDTWLESLDVAANRLKEWSGARELGVCGVLLGGTLGVLLANRRQDVTALVLWGTYFKGRSAVRAGLAAMVGLNSNPEGKEPSTAQSGDQESLGFLLTQAMIEDLLKIDLMHTSPRTVRSALLLPRTANSPERKLAGHLVSSGTKVDVHEQSSDDLADLLQSSGSGIPKKTIEDIAGWLMYEYPDQEAVQRIAPRPFDPPEIVLHEAGNSRVRESIVHLGADGGVFGIFSEPVDHEAQELAVLLVTGGLNHRAGINRNYTEWARFLASRGYRVLRMDLRGFGDSPPCEPELASALYRDEACADVVDAAIWLKTRGAGSVAAVGLCAGAYHSFHAALTDSPIAGVVMLNPLRFHNENLWDLGSDLLPKDLWHQSVKQDKGMLEHALPVLRFVRRMMRRYLPLTTRVGRASRRISQSFFTLSKRGIDVFIIYNENEPVLKLFQHAIRSVRDDIESRGNFRIVTVGHSDHIYSPLWSQEEVSGILFRYFDELNARVSTHH